MMKSDRAIIAGGDKSYNRTTFSKHVMNKVSVSQLPNTVSVSFKGVKAAYVIASLASKVRG